MARVTLKIPWSFRSWLFVFIMVSWLTGLTFFVLNRWITVEGDFGPEKHPLQAVFLKIHGGSAFFMMIAYGYLLASHVPAGWKSRRQRRLGLALVGAQGFLILTAYGLYYASADDFRVLLGYAHASVGLIFPLILALHLITGSRSRRSGKARVISGPEPE